MLDKPGALRRHLKEVAGAHNEMKKGVYFYPFTNARQFLRWGTVKNHKMLFKNGQKHLFSNLI